MPITSEFSAAAQTLVALESPRVWSVLVSIFGDLAFRNGDHLEGPLLTRLTDAMDIKPEAVRVALHRLRNDGWIDSVKSGRTAHHALTKSAMRERKLAAPLIYNRVGDMPQGWQMAVASQGDVAIRDRLSEAGFVQLTPRIFVANEKVPAPDGVLQSVGTQAPDWARSELVPDDLTEQFSRLHNALKDTARRVAKVKPAERSLIETALIRCLVIHQWRRLVLRHPYLPPSLLGADWPGHACRTLVCDLLDELERPALDALAAEDRFSAT